MALRVAGSSPVIHPTFSALCRGRLRAAQRISQKAGAFFMCRPLRLLYLSACCAFLRFSCFAGFFCFLCAALRVLPCLRSLLHSLRASCAFRPKPAFFVRLVLFNRGSFAFCALFLFRSFVVLLARILRLCIFFFSLGYLLRFPGAACAPFCGFSAVGTDDAESILSSGCGSVGRAGGLGPSGRRFESCHSDHQRATKKM